MKKYLFVFLFPLLVCGCANRQENTLDEDTCIKLAFCIPDHGMEDGARYFFTEDYLAAWDAINALPDVADYAGYLPEKEWIYFFVSGNGDCEDMQVRILSSKANDSTATVSFYYTCSNVNEEDCPRHTMQLIRRNEVWLIDEYDSTKQKMLDWIANAKSDFLEGSRWKELLQDSMSNAAFQQQMENYLNSPTYKSVIQKAE